MNAILPFLELPIADTQVCWVDQLPENLPQATMVEADVYAKPGELLIKFPELAKFRITHGRQIEVSLLPRGTPDAAAFFLMSTPFGALIHQRGELPLHAAAVISPEGSALLIAGYSGAGKSTTAALLAQRGWTVLNDDVSRVTFNNGEAHVWSGFTKLKLCKRSCDLLHLDSGMLSPTRGKKEKFFWQSRPDSTICEQSFPIAAIVELAHGYHDIDAGTISRQRGAAAMQMMMRHTFRRQLILPLGCQASHFSQLQNNASRLRCYQVANSHSLMPSTLADLLTKLLESENVDEPLVY